MGVYQQKPAVLITGASKGVGRAAAECFAEAGWLVALVGRSLDEGQRLCDEIGRRRHNRNVAFLKADLGCLDSVRALCDEVLDRARNLKVVINNATVVPQRLTRNRAGLELQFAVNHLAPFAIANALAGRLIDRGPARIITVTSEAHHHARPALFESLSEADYEPVRVFERTKLYNVLFSYELARRLRGSGVTANAVSLNASDIRIRRLYEQAAGSRRQRWEADVRRALRRLPLLGELMPRPQTPGDAARTLFRLAAAPQLAAVSGCYFDRERIARSSRASYDDGVAQTLWELSARLVGSNWPQLGAADGDLVATRAIA